MTLVGKFTDLTERDGFGRVTARNLKLSGKSKAIIADSYTYLNNEIATGNWRETNFVASVSQTVGRDSVEFAYTYDNSGNIVKIERDGRNYRNYKYDGLNRLTAEDNYEVMRRYEWSYDDGGNITEKRVYILNGSGDDPIATIPYGYDSIWKDKLVSYNGNTGFAYDNLGNPTKYKGIDLTWTNVRRLASYGNNTFEYGADGIRFKKNNTTYTLDGNRILRETDGTKTITYYYGTNGVVGFRYNNADYFYHKNLQGDVLAIYDTNGIKQAEYEYDAWGKVLNVINCECCCCDIGNINPFRYRSYYYDVETGLYYLQTRYYDPEVGRFINSDSVAYLGKGKELINYNLFAYCSNNPVNRVDYMGTEDDDHDGRPDDEDNDFKDDDEEDACNPASGGFSGWSWGGDSGGTSSGTYSNNRGTPSYNGINNYTENIAPKADSTINTSPISPSDSIRIQNAANRTHQTIIVVGSRASGTAGPDSDWDYIMTGNSAQRHSAASSVPRGTGGGANNTGIDIFSAYENGPNPVKLDYSKPYLIFKPKK